MANFGRQNRPLAVAVLAGIGQGRTTVEAG
jgi:hypothetical protein